MGQAPSEYSSMRREHDEKLAKFVLSPYDTKKTHTENIGTFGEK